MASSEEIQRLVGKLMLDPVFRREFSGDPAAAAQSIGITLTPEEVDSFKANFAAFVSAAAELEKTAATTVGATADAAGHVAAIFNA